MFESDTSIAAIWKKISVVLPNSFILPRIGEIIQFAFTELLELDEKEKKLTNEAKATYRKFNGKAFTVQSVIYEYRQTGYNMMHITINIILEPA